MNFDHHSINKRIIFTYFMKDLRLCMYYIPSDVISFSFFGMF